VYIADALHAPGCAPPGHLSHATRTPSVPALQPPTLSAATGGPTIPVPVANTMMSPLAMDPSCPHPPRSHPLSAAHYAVTALAPPHMSTVSQPLASSTASMAMVATAVATAVAATPLATATLASPTPDQPAPVVRVLSATAASIEPRAASSCSDGVTSGHVHVLAPPADPSGAVPLPPLVPLARVSSHGRGAAGLCSDTASPPCIRPPHGASTLGRGVASSSSETGALEASEDAGAEPESEVVDGEEAADEETLTEQSSTKKHKHNIAERVRLTARTQARTHALFCRALQSACLRATCPPVFSQRRTSRLNSLFEELGVLVSSRPDLFCDSGRRHSKADVLMNSIACMRSLFSSVDRMRMPLGIATNPMAATQVTQVTQVTQPAVAISSTGTVPVSSPQPPASLYTYSDCGNSGVASWSERGY
jgi:hypothetical protein